MTNDECNGTLYYSLVSTGTTLALLTDALVERVQPDALPPELRRSWAELKDRLNVTVAHTLAVATSLNNWQKGKPLDLDE